MAMEFLFYCFKTVTGKKNKLKPQLSRYLDPMKWATPEDMVAIVSGDSFVVNDPGKKMQLAIIQGDLPKLKSILSSQPDPTEMMNSVHGTGWNSVILATFVGHIDVLKYLLDMGADVESPNGGYYGLLSIACKLQRFSVIPILLQHGVDPCFRNQFGVTTLHAIAKFGTVATAEMVFGNIPSKLKTIINWSDDFGMTALLYGVTAGRLEVCQWLINRGADITIRGGRRETPFIMACHYGNVAIMKLFISIDITKTYEMLHEEDEEGMNGLHHAVSENNMEATLTLISLGVDVNSSTHDGSTALHICAKSGYSALATVLIQSGAKPDVCDKKSSTPLHRAAERHHTETLAVLVHQGAYIDHENAMGCTALYIACYSGYTDMVEKLLSLHADYMVTDCLGKSCLHVAVEERHWDVFSILLNTCDRTLVSLKDISQRTALHKAAILNETKFAEALLRFEELVHERSASGQLPLHCAASSGNCTMIRLLADVTDDINAETHDCKTPLIYACETGQTKSGLVLIQMGANVNHRILNSYNTLMVATSSGSSSLVDALIRSGVNVNSVDHAKNTALHLACHHGHLSIVRTLLKNGASVTATNAKGDTPLLVAVQQSREDVATFLMKHESWEDSLSVEDGYGQCCLEKMTAQTPKAAKILLDKCMTTSGHPQGDQDFKVELNFKYLETDTCDKHFKEKAYRPFMTMIANEREDLLEHPVCQAFLVYKWNAFGRAYLLFNIFVQFAFFCFALIYLHYVPSLDAVRNEDGCNIEPSPSLNSSNLSHSDSSLEKSQQLDYDDFMLTCSSLGMVVTLCMVVLKEIRFSFASGWRYLISGQFMSTMVAAGFILGSFYPIGQSPCALQWSLLAVGIAVYGYSSSMVFTRIDYIGLYFSMFFEVLSTIVKMSVVLVFFIIIISIPLRIYLRLQKGFTQGDPFPVTALAMMVGELNFRDMFLKADNSPFTKEANIYFTLFVLILNITFMNMMIGAAVGDIENVEKRAYVTRLKSQVTFLEEVESTFVPAMRQRFSLKRHVVYPNQKWAKWIKLVRRFTSYDAMMFIKRDDDHDDIQNLNEVIGQQNDQIKELKEITLTMKAELKKLAQLRSRAESVDEDLAGEVEELDDQFSGRTYLNNKTSSRL